MCSGDEVSKVAGVNVNELNKLLLVGDTSSIRQRRSTLSISNSKFNISNSLQNHVVNTDSVEDVIDYLDNHKQGNTWLDCQEYLLEDIVDICQAAFGGIHPLTLELCSSESQREALQEVNSYTFFFLGQKNSIIIYGNGIISLTLQVSQFREGIHQQLNCTLPHTREWICYALFARMSSSLLPIISQIDRDANWVNEHVYVTYDDADGQSVLDCLAETRNKTLKLTLQLRTRLELIEALIRRWANHEVAHYFESIKDSLITTKQRLEAHESLLGNTHRNWMAVTQMNLEKVKSKALVVVGQFLAVATVFIPMLTVYTSGHMNLDGPGMGGKKTTLTYWGIIQGVTLCCAILIVIGLSRFFRSIMNRPAPSLIGI